MRRPSARCTRRIEGREKRNAKGAARHANDPSGGGPPACGLRRRGRRTSRGGRRRGFGAPLLPAPGREGLLEGDAAAPGLESGAVPAGAVHSGARCPRMKAGPFNQGLLIFHSRHSRLHSRHSRSQRSPTSRTWRAGSSRPSRTDARGAELRGCGGHPLVVRGDLRTAKSGTRRALRATRMTLPAGASVNGTPRPLAWRAGWFRPGPFIPGHDARE